MRASAETCTIVLIAYWYVRPRDIAWSLA